MFSRLSTTEERDRQTDRQTEIYRGKHTLCYVHSLHMHCTVGINEYKHKTLMISSYYCNVRCNVSEEIQALSKLQNKLQLEQAIMSYARQRTNLE